MSYRDADVTRVDDDSTHDQYEPKKEEKFNWWPLFVLPIAFFAGWGANEAMSQDDRAYTNGAQYGVGGAPDEICVTSMPTQ